MNILAVVGPSSPDRLGAMEYYRVVDPLESLIARGHKARIAYGGRITQGDVTFADVIYFCGCGFDTFERFGWFRKLAKGKAVVVDLNDDHWAPESPVNDRDRRTNEVMLTGADFVTTTTETLVAIAHGVAPCIAMTIPNAENAARWRVTEGLDRPQGLTVGYWGGITHQGELRLVSGLLARLAKRYPDLTLIVAGDLELPDKLKPLDESGRLYRVPGVPFPRFPAVVNCVDIVLAPLADTQFNRSRTPVRWMQAAMLARPVIANPTVYGKVIKHGKTGFVARTDAEWERYAVKLIESAELRKTIGEAAREDVLRKHTPAATVDLWEAAFETARKGAK